MGILLAALVTVSGIVTAGDAALPGATVTLTDGTVWRTIVTNVEGHYSFPGVPAGTYDVLYELDGLESAKRRVAVAGANVVVDQKLELGPVETLTISCSFTRCRDDVPTQTSYDDPLCSDYELNGTLIETARAGDRSARDLLRSRYTHTLSLYERSRIGAALDDTGIWRDLLALAELCVRFPREDHEYSQAWLEWCASRNQPAEDHWQASLDALIAISDHARSRDLLRKALESKDDVIASLAVYGLAEQRDLASLPAIEQVLPRFADEIETIQTLALFRSEAADAIAMKFLEDDFEREEYQRIRDGREPEP
ncbi:MAG TPA: carboxypeptidase-like regulatory domain-containing protein [Thermoanaerobaculia bacterium]|nr:carboxypeptidase-like regulatory domain-containing protein [Thermoanaerobaculia bacterium]